MNIRKAVIPVAGLGTRMLPGSKLVPKELFPIGTVPALFYVLSEVVRAGIEVVVLVNAPWKSNLDNILVVPEEIQQAAAQKPALAKRIQITQQLADRIDIISVRQDRALGLGHAVHCAAPVIGDDPFAVLLADELMLDRPGATRQLIEAAHNGGAVGVLPVPAQETHRYGIVDLDAASAPAPIRSMVEKPPQGQAPSNLAIIGRYVFPRGFQRCLRNLQPGAGGELQLTDAMRDNLDTHTLTAVEVSGPRHDIGNDVGYAATWQAYLDDPDAFHHALSLA